MNPVLQLHLLNVIDAGDCRGVNVAWIDRIDCQGWNSGSRHAGVERAPAVTPVRGLINRAIRTYVQGRRRQRAGFITN